MSDLALRVDGLSKSFRLGHGNQRGTLSQRLGSLVRKVSRRGGHNTANAPSGSTSDNTFWALQDVSFEVKRGDVVGIVGRNGAGKSTLLKLLSRITFPTRGRMEIRGRVRSLLEVGTGFHDDLTGRENIYLNGAILGMSRSEIARKFDEIVAFSEVERFLDTPVKRYSSGMYLRLAFAVAANLEPEILIIDEVLAVGDAAFQKKCIGKLGESCRQGKTVLIVSHSLPVVTSFCQRAVLLEGGRVTAIGAAADVVRKYMTSFRSAFGEVVWPSPEAAPGDESIKLCSISVLQEGIEGPTADLDISKEVDICVKYWNLVAGQETYVAIALKDTNGTLILTSSNVESGNTNRAAWSGPPQSEGLHSATCRIPEIFLNEGRYVISLNIGNTKGEIAVEQDSILTFSVHDTGAMHEEYIGNWAGPVIRPRLSWNTIHKTSD